MRSPLAVRAAALLLAVALLPAARGVPAARGDEAAADDAAGKLIAAKAFATTKVASEQWFASYAGSCWTHAVKVTVAKDGELRLVEIERLSTRDKDYPGREHDRWWFDANGTLVKGERKTFTAGHEPPELDLKYEINSKKNRISVRQADTPKSESMDLPKQGNFVPDSLLALLIVPEEKGQVWRFGTLGGDNDFAYFTVEDMGKEKVALRAGTVEAHKLKVTEPGGETHYWIDAEHRILAAKYPSLPNIALLAGTEEESRADWWTRPRDEADEAAEKLAKTGLEAQSGALVYGDYSEEGELKATATARFAKKEKDGKAVFEYASTISEIGSGATVSTEEWSFTADNKLLSGHYQVRGARVDQMECKLRVEGDKMISTLSDAPDGKEEMPFAIPPRMVADSYFLMKPCASAGQGGYRFHGFDLAGRYVYSIFIAVKGEEEITFLGGKVKARHLVLMQNVAEADVWVDAKGELLLVSWKDGDKNVFGPHDKLPPHLPEHFGHK